MRQLRRHPAAVVAALGLDRLNEPVRGRFGRGASDNAYRPIGVMKMSGETRTVRAARAQEPTNRWPTKHTKDTKS
jgi:hypothetical protein